MLWCAAREQIPRTPLQQDQSRGAMTVIVTTDRSRWILLGVYSLSAAILTVALTRGLTLLGSDVRISFSQWGIIRSLGAIVWAPTAWNVFPRLEYRHKLLSRFTGGDRTIAHYAFAFYIVCFSSLREKLFFAAIDENGVWSTGKFEYDNAIKLFGRAVLVFGAFLSACGFYHLRIKFTYMGEYFGFMMPALITSFPFNAFPDPMYNGSVLMHFGYAFMALSPTGFYLSCITGLSYWTAAKIFEEYVWFSEAKCLLKV